MRRIGCLIMTSVIMISAITGCGDKSKEYEPRDMEYVQESEWFNNNVYETTKYDDMSSAAWNDSPIVYADSDMIIIDENLANNTDEVHTNRISQYALKDDGECECLASIDLAETGLYYVSDDYTSGMDCVSFIYANDKLYAFVNEYDYNAVPYVNNTFIQELDLENECLGTRFDTQEINELFERGYATKIWCDGDEINLLISADDINWKNSTYVLVKLNSNFEIVSEDGIDGFNEDCWVEDVFIISDTQLLVRINNFNTYEREWCIVDTDTNTVTKKNDIPEELAIGNWNNVSNTIVGANINGISIYDVESNAVEEVLNFNNCNIDRFQSNTMKVTYATHDCIVAWDLAWDFDDADEGLGFRVWKFNRADSNPNVGKGIIKLALLDGKLTPTIGNAIYEFNEQSDAAYMILDDRYDVNNFVEDDNYSDNYEYQMSDKYSEVMLNAETALSNQLRVDIMAGEGPDIVINGFAHSEFNNDNCMMELKELLVDSGEINPDDYLPAVFGFADEVYQLPYYLSPMAIRWRDEFAAGEVDSYGITYEQYDNWVNEHCNGKDPVSEMNTRNNYMLVLFNNSIDRFVHDGKVELDNEEFRALAEFAATRSENYTYNIYSYNMNPDAFFYGSGWGIDFSMIKHHVVTGLPSMSGDEGIAFNCSGSIGIASTCPLVDESVAFVKSIIEANSNNIGIEGLRTACEKYAESLRKNDFNLSESEMNYRQFTEDDIDAFMELMTSSTKVVTPDADISVIIYEEMQPYFAGDKTIDEVIPIIEDRCTTVINERG